MALISATPTRNDPVLKYAQAPPNTTRQSSTPPASWNSRGLIRSVITEKIPPSTPGDQAGNIRVPGRDAPASVRLVDDDAFLLHVGDRLAGLPAVEAVTLGGSRAEGTHRPDSDWYFSIYYRGLFDPQTLRDIGWPGEVSEIGGWSNGVFNGGAWLEIDGRRADVHYRDLDTVDREMAAPREGRFSTEPLMFHLAGIPSYLVLAELAVKQVLRGQLPTPEYPAALRQRAPQVWWR